MVQQIKARRYIMENEKITKDYRGYSIEYNEGTDLWYVFDDTGANVFSKEKLSDAKTRIDKIFDTKKKAKKFERIHVFVDKFSNIVEATITSVGEKRSRWGSVGATVYYSHSENRRDSMDVSFSANINKIAKDTPENREKFDRYNANIEAISKLSRANVEIKESINWITGEEFEAMLKERLGE